MAAAMLAKPFTRSRPHNPTPGGHISSKDQGRAAVLATVEALHLVQPVKAVTFTAILANGKAWHQLTPYRLR